METPSALQSLLNELGWLEQVIDQAIKSYLMHEGHELRWQDIELPNLEEDDSPYANTVKEWDLNTYHRLALALGLAAHLKPELLDVFFGKNQMYDRGFTEFGGVIDKNHSGFLPTGQTLLFLVVSSQPELRYEVMETLGPDSILTKENVLILSDTEEHIPKFNGVLGLSEPWLHFFLTGSKPNIEQSAAFPAKRITTKLDWEDVVLDATVMEQVQEINAWLNHGSTIMEAWGLDRMLKPGYRSLFYGPPGTGKTLTATLLGKASGREVYKVDLSMIVSKYIGETEKNLAKVFDIAQHKDWILFFDEADALFGKRTMATSSNDRHANQQTSYLLQRIEDFPGVVILASNLKANMDDAFTRRFQSMIYFMMPTAEDRYLLWQNAFSGTCQLSEEIDLMQIANDYELTGGAIINVLRYCALSAVSRGSTVVEKKELLFGIRAELKKENKTM